jgi:phosphonate transport system substrate-binding protein
MLLGGDPMSSKRAYWTAVGLLVLLLALVACQPAEPVEVTRIVTEVSEVEVPVEVEVTRVVTEIQTQTVTEVVEVEQAELGSEERPIKVLFVPSVEVDQIVAGGEVLAQALEEATGLQYEVSVPTSYAATVEEMCASPSDTIGFIPAQGYILANNRCGVTVGAAAVRRGLSWYASQFVVRADSGIDSLEDLEGLTWAVPDVGSTSGYLYPLSMLQNMGITPGEIIEAGGHPQAMLAVYNGDADFGTAFFSPPLLPSDLGRTWTYGVDDPEIWRDAGEDPVRTEEGSTLVAGGPDAGGYQILDARGQTNDVAPTIFADTRILALTDQIPNDTVSFGPSFPLALSSQIVNALVEFTASDQCAESICSEDFYSWTGVEPVPDSFYDPVRILMEELGISEEDVFGG